MAPWRYAFFNMSWTRWQFWLFAGILSYAVIPVVEELLFRGYYQRRLAEDWGKRSRRSWRSRVFFIFSHKQYLIANAYNVDHAAKPVLSCSGAWGGLCLDAIPVSLQ